MRALRILIANATMASRTGTETYVRDLALGLLRRGHSPIVYAPELGNIARELKAESVTVVDDLNAIDVPPDIIHGNHNTELVSALLHFPGVAALFFCHSGLDWNASPPLHPRILAYVAVDETCRNRLLSTQAINETRVRLCLNAVDMDRFKPRGPLPLRPLRALVFSNNANQWTHLSAVREACAGAKIELDVAGAGADALAHTPESILGDYDLVFAKARCALEAMAVGAAVILCDAPGSGPLVTTSDFDRLRRMNFGFSALCETVNADHLTREISRYDAADASEVSRRVRAGADLGAMVDDVLAMYRDVINEYQHMTPPDPEEEARATATYLRWVTQTLRLKQQESEAMLANSLTLRVRNRLSRLPIFEWPLRRLGRLVRRRDE